MMDRFVVDDIHIPDDIRTPILDLITRHVSVRSFDTARTLSEAQVTAIVAAAQSAPTSSNLQAYSIVQVENPALRDRLLPLCLNQAFVREAPLFLIFCPDIYRLRWIADRQGYPVTQGGTELLVLAVTDAALACQNAALAAESLGLGTCMCGSVRDHPREVAELLKLPPGVFALVGLAAGYALSRNPVKPRLPQSVVFHKDFYRTDALEPGLLAYDSRMARTGIYEGSQMPVPAAAQGRVREVPEYGYIEHTARRLAREEGRHWLGDVLRALGYPIS